MIQNREQLLSMASMWVNEAKNDIRNQAMAFMNEMHVSEEQLAYVLGISRGEVEQILRGNGEISLSTFAKILIATDNMIEIKPLGVTPFAQSPNNFPHPHEVQPTRMRRPQRPMPRRMPFGGPMTHSRPFGNMPLSPSMRNAMGETPQPTCDMEETPLLLDSMSRSQLIDEIVKNGWGGEININSASRSQLIAFLANKGQSVVNAFGQTATPCREPRMVAPNVEDVVPEEMTVCGGQPELNVDDVDSFDDDWIIEDGNPYDTMDEVMQAPRGVEPDIPRPTDVVEGTPTEDTIARLTSALRTNPQLVEALRNIIG